MSKRKNSRNLGACIIAVVLVLVLSVTAIALVQRLSLMTGGFQLFEVPQPLGGREHQSFDFSKNVTWTDNGYGALVSEYGFSSDKDVSEIEVSDGKFNITVADYAGGASDPYAIIGYNEQIAISDYAAMTYDFDVSVTENYAPLFKLYIDFRNGSGNWMSDANGAVTYEKGSLWNVHGTKLLDVNDRFHVTLVLVGTSMNLYVDGEYVYSFSGLYDATQATTVRGINAHLYLTDAAIEGTHTVSFDNYHVRIFDVGYEGPLNELISEPEQSLEENPDSILYKGARPDEN